MSTETKIIKFAKHWRGYNPGEVAGFDAATAEALETAKIAEPHGPGQDGKKPALRPQAGTGRRATKAPEGTQQTDAGTSTAQDAAPITTPPGDATTPNQDAAASSAQTGGPTDNDDRP